ncbi:MAG: hypothetical protein KGP35_10210 [Bacteroidetes bacterium]|nr:hypothetical protein [Bacteroidota bacterium]
MLKGFITILLNILLAYISGIFLPWWGMIPVLILLYAFVALKPGWAFLCGFMAMFLLWGLLALQMDVANNHLLSKKISTIFFQKEASTLLILVTALTGALVGGLSALTGALARGIRKVS